MSTQRCCLLLVPTREILGSHTPDLHGSLSPTTGTQPGAAADKTPPALPAGWAPLQLCVAAEVKSTGILVCVARGLACSRGRKGAGVDEHLLDNFAVCCRNIAACVVDVASHHIVGEVRLQNDVLGVHMHLKKTGSRGKGTWSEGCASLGHQARWWRGRQTERGTRGGEERLCGR